MPKAQYVTKQYFDEAQVSINEKFEEVLRTVKEGFDDLGTQVGEVRTKTENLEKEVVKIRAIMVDKDYLDKKIAELRGELVLTIRKEDTKTNLLIDILKEGHVLKDSDVVRLKEIVVFPVFHE